LIVRHEDERDSEIALYFFEFDLHLLAQLQVECPQWFIEQEHLGFNYGRSRESHTLALSSRELTRLAVAETG